MPENIVIADTSCLIALAKIKALLLLKALYSNIFITSEIAREFDEVIPEWILVEEVTNKNYLQILATRLDIGEASAIALAMEKRNVLLILDDLKGRKEAEKLGFAITGTLGVLFKAQRENVIESIKPYLNSLKTVGFRISSELEMNLLKRSGEK
ncbi:MAG: DUF3368 domain-containing protein [Bacteroidia bacterium]|nr:DUF3368 domain-containing protein [Bacteroidia bacterium]